LEECPICGREVEKLYTIELEGTLIEVCESCASEYGHIQKLETLKPKKKIVKKEDQLELVPNYYDLIRLKREEKGLTRKEFAQILNEKESVIKRIEDGRMRMDDNLAKKIEKILGIKLFYRPKEKKVRTKKIKSELTIGDIVEIR